MKNLLISIAIGFLTSACAFTTDRIDVPYQSTNNAAPIVGASAATLSVAANDARTTYRDRVSTKKNGYGMEMAAIIATNDIPQTVGKAIEQELRARGYEIGPGHATISVAVHRFYNDFQVGFFSSDATASVVLDVTVRDPASSIVFAKSYSGIGREANILMVSGSNARAALIKAFQNAVNSVVSDKALQAAIFAAQQPRTAGATAVPSS
jgi:uncharacterized lipoprotein YajG